MPQISAKLPMNNCAALSLVALMAVPRVWGAKPVDYETSVKPILAENCYRCHGMAQQKSGLRVDTATFAREGGKNGPAIKPGKSEESLMVQVLKGTHPELSRMPYKKAPLVDAQIALIAQWITEGAQAPADEQPEKNQHWAFIKPRRGPLPAVKRTAWPRNAIDQFVLARLEKEGIAPAAEADRVTLLRRVSLDLLGLPPTIEEVDAFLKDARPDAYEWLVDRLLASPHYGERWGRHWLDVARYADSNGYSIDAPRAIWKYRDWVIDALNRDLPFDQFIIEQLAGDLLPGATLEQKIATGFHRNTQINQEGGIDPEQFRVESVIDRVNTTATAFLGLTLGCAQCHDHKFDPFAQREYYQFYAFFNNTIEDGHGKGAPEGVLEIPGEIEAPENLQKDLEEAEADLDRYLDVKGSEVVKWEQTLSPEDMEKLAPEVRRILPIPYARRTAKEKRTVYAAFREDDPEFKLRNGKLTRLEKRQSKPVSTLVMLERPEPRESFVFINGDFTRRGDLVTPAVPAILNPLPAARMWSARGPSTLRSTVTEDGRADFGGPPKSEPTLDSEIKLAAPSKLASGSTALANRLDLARWLVDPENPLTARVMVNRLWQQYFGRGIVETENDFGTQGSPPTHPELLDWLATELVQHDAREAEPALSPQFKIQKPKSKIQQPVATSRVAPGGAWSLKRIHRLMATSATYRQSSRIRPDLAAIDPYNKLLARQARIRLDAEIVRDVCLRASGLLNEKIGGPSVFPLQPGGVMTLGQLKRDWRPSKGQDRYRRGLYTFFWRATPHPALMVFDGADAFSTCTRRVRSNTPLQGLTLLNDEAFYECAQALAARVLKDGTKADPARLEIAFRRCVSRSPTREEERRLLDLLDKERAAFEKAPQEAEAIAGSQRSDKTDLMKRAAWTTVSRVLLNLDETITRE